MAKTITIPNPITTGPEQVVSFRELAVAAIDDYQQLLPFQDAVENAK